MFAGAAQGNAGLGLRALLCVVFDKDQGPTIRCADPEGAVDTWSKPLGHYLLPSEWSGGRVVSKVMGDNVIIGAPVYISDDGRERRYDRNCFQFIICFVISTHVDSEPHQELAQHLAAAFHKLETEERLISKHWHKDGSLESVRDTLAELRRQLNSSDECFVRIDCAESKTERYVSFRVRCSPPALAAMPALAAVPVPLVDIAGELRRRTAGAARGPGGGEGAAEPAPPAFAYQPDLALTHILPYVDGKRSVLEVVDASGADEDTVLICLRHLLHFGLIAMIDAIRPENRYSLTPEFHFAFERGSQVPDEVVGYVTAGRVVQKDDKLVQVVQLLYAKMDGLGQTVQTLEQFRQKNERLLKDNCISLRHLVTYGLLRGLLERSGSCDQKLTHLEWREMKRLQTALIPRRKKDLELNQGMSKTQANQDPQVKAMVSRMMELKDREQHGVEGFPDQAAALPACTAPSAPCGAGAARPPDGLGPDPQQGAGRDEPSP